MAQYRVDVKIVKSRLELIYRTRTQNLTVMTVSLTDIAAEDWWTATVD